MKKRSPALWIVACVLVLAIVGYFVSNRYTFRPWEHWPRHHIANEADYDRAVAAYVRQKTGWSDSQFVIFYTRKDGNLLVFYVQYNFILPRSKGHLGSDGKSFSVKLDPETKKVVGEIHVE